MIIKEKKIAIIGLGYVGLPLAIEFGKKYDVIGFDINKERIKDLLKGKDKTNEANLKEMSYVTNHKKNEKDKGLTFTSNDKDLIDCNIYIVTVPTPINQFKSPNLTPLLKASKMIGKMLKKGDIVIYESTVYPGCTEDDCVPVLEKYSGLKFNLDFYCGYSPERINPGDKKKKLDKINKLVSASNQIYLIKVYQIYRKSIKSKVIKVNSIKIAEGAKIIENTQRDLNIALINELSKIFQLMEIDTKEVIEAAATKWNFIPMMPGLVGGHCIGVDPYYLTYKAAELGYDPEVILSGRSLNNSIGPYVADKCLELMLSNNKTVSGSRILLMGYTFKENCPDTRNTRVIDIVKKLQKFCEIDIYDPWINKDDLEEEEISNILVSELKEDYYDAIIFAVAHDVFKEMDLQQIKKLIRPNSPILDLKGIFPKSYSDFRL